MKLKKYILVIVLILFIVTACSTPELPTNTPNQPNKPDLTNSEIKYSEPELRAFSECWIQDNNAVYGEFLENKSCTALARLLTTAPGYGKNPINNLYYGGLEYINIQQQKGITYSLLVDSKDSVKPCHNLVLFRKGDDPIGHTVVVFSVDLKNDILYYLDQNYAGMGITLRSIKISTEGKNAYIIPSSCRKKIDYKKCGPIIDTQTVEIENTSPSPSKPTLPSKNHLDYIQGLYYMFSTGDYSLIDFMVRKSGTQFYLPIGVGFSPPGIDNEDEVRSEFVDSIDLEKATCVGWVPPRNSKFTIYFKDARLKGIPSNQVSYFLFMILEEDFYELLVMGYTNEDDPSIIDLPACPSVTNDSE